MRIGELARLTGCEVETIRYYEKEGLLGAPERSSAGYRRYLGEHVGALNFIRHCRSLGMSLAEIRKISAYRDDPSLACDEINDLIDLHIGKVHEQIESLRLLEQQLQVLRQRCDHSSDAAHCGILQTLVGVADGEACACHHTPFTASDHPARA